MNDGLVGDQTRTSGANLLVGVSLNNMNLRGINLAVNHRLYLYNSLRASGLLDDGRVYVGLNDSWQYVLNDGALVERSLHQAALLEALLEASLLETLLETKRDTCKMPLITEACAP